MPLAQRSPRPVREHKTICLPGSQAEYERVVGDPEGFRKLLDRHIKSNCGTSTVIWCGPPF